MRSYAIILFFYLSLGSMAYGQQVGVGEQAPDFSVTALGNQTVKLSDYSGKPVVLLFSRAHW